MVIGHHLIFTAYGCWLPNDPRGSTSASIRNAVIADLGEIHYGRKRVQPTGARLREFYADAEHVLRHERRTFGADDRERIAVVFGAVIRRERYTCYACAIMPDHVHLLIRKHRDHAETMIEKLQQESRSRLLDDARFPRHHPVWGGPGWKVYLDTPDDIRRTIRYIEANPLPYRMPAPKYPFVDPFDGWSLRDAARKFERPRRAPR
ncbi:MAG: transposase [Phycisphaerales bacterium]